MFKKTKIVATIGPVTESKESMEKLVKAGMNVVRLNFSHGDHDEHLGRVKLARATSEKFNEPIAVLQDLSGPKIRIGDFYKDSIVLKKGQLFTLTVEKIVGDEKKVFVNYKELPNEINEGSVIMLNDGKNKLMVEKISGQEIHCKVIVGGEIKGRRGVNIPGAYLKISAITAKDKKDIKFGIENEVDFMAISFVRTSADILKLRGILDKAKADIKIIAKIETTEAIENIDEIIAVADGIMVARGDLAVEVSAEQVPVLQKMIIKKCNDLGKPVITATQMLESMINSPVPTRAEVSDIANAIYDGTDAVMLSEESTLGKYAVEAVETMNRVARYTEHNFNYEKELERKNLLPKLIADAISFSIANTSHNIGAKAIVALTESGFTARIISRYKPKEPIIAFTPNKKTFNRLALSFGCYPELIKNFNTLEDVMETAKKDVVKKKIVKKGDKIVIAAGVPFGYSGTTNLVLAQEI